MSERFWIQGEDGKLEGSLPNVPKKGFTGDGSENENQPDVSKVQNIIVADNADEKRIIPDKQLMDTLKMLKRGLRLGMKADELLSPGINNFIFPLKYVTALVEMFVQNRKMIEAMKMAREDGIDPRELDNYYHCRAHCSGKKAGLGSIAAFHIGYAKEVFDLFLHVFGVGTIQGSIDERIIDSIADSIEDMSANFAGRMGDPRISCNDTCDQLWPQGVPREFRDKVDQKFERL
ncbi:MAG: hypothetical protein HQL01_10300 [Nitrospirae bacterium]|nr:hypothetical protein [Nitrospirota bacterium]